MTDWSRKWDNHEKKLDESDIKSGEPDKEKIEVITEEQSQDVPLSGLFCIYCHNFAIHIYQGNSLCHECFNKEMAELIKNKK